MVLSARHVAWGSGDRATGCARIVVSSYGAEYVIWLGTGYRSSPASGDRELSPPPMQVEPSSSAMAPFSTSIMKAIPFHTLTPRAEITLSWTLKPGVTRDLCAWNGLT